MAGWSRAQRADYERLPLHAHALLADVPLHDVWQVELPGGGPDRSLADLRALLGDELRSTRKPAVRLLFALRRAIGRALGWDAPTARDAPPQRRVPPQLLERSLVPPGSADGPFRVVYVHEREAMSEVRNATVHAFSVLALDAVAGGYRATWAIHVAPVGAITPLYMALIDPFRRWIVYPALLERVHLAWRERWAEPGPRA